MKQFSTQLKPLEQMPIIPWELEVDDCDRAKDISQLPLTESGQWQAYLNALALLGFRQWMTLQFPDALIQQHTDAIELMGQLEVYGFKLALIATEHVLDEAICVPQQGIQGDLQSHFYIFVEVLEEEACYIIRGFTRRDHLLTLIDRWQLQPSESGFYTLPLSMLDAEINHLLAYCRFLSPAVIIDPNWTKTPTNSNTIETSTIRAVQANRTKLSEWLTGIIDENWQMVETLINPDFSLALATRSLVNATKRGKLIDLGIQIGKHKVALILTVTPAIEGKLSVNVQVHPTSFARTLPPGLKLAFISPEGKVQQEVESRQFDNYIQLPTFKGKSGTYFSVRVSYGELTLLEDFEL